MLGRIETGEAPAGHLRFEGQEIPFRSGESVAAALLAAGVGATRIDSVDASPRAPYCMMGVCFECLMVIDGVMSRQGCLVPARDGMTVARQLGARMLG
jgi:hypothetical protein